MTRRASVVGLALLALTFASVACGGATDQQRIPAPGTFIYTVGVDLWIQDAAGARLLIEAGQDQQLLQPAISPDGIRVAYVIFQLTQAEGTTVGTDLAVSPIEEPRQELLVQHQRQAEYVWNPRWTPDGGSLIFTHEPGDGTIGVLELELETRTVERLRADARDAAISADGRQLVLVNAPLSGDPHLVVRNLDSGEERALDPEREWQPRPYRLPRFTPDGEAVIFAAGQYLPQLSASAMALNGPEDIWRVDLASGELTQLAAIGEDQPDFAVSDDGRHVFVLGAFGIYLVSATPGEPPYAIAPGEFHGSVDWRGRVSDEEWTAIREAAWQPPGTAE